MNKFINNLKGKSLDFNEALLRQQYNALNPLIKQKAKIILLPIAGNIGVLYGMDNRNGNVIDFDFARSSSATLFDSTTNIQLVGNDVPRIDYNNYSNFAKILIEKSSTNLFSDSMMTIGINEILQGATKVDSDWFNFFTKKIIIRRPSSTGVYLYYKSFDFNFEVKDYVFSTFASIEKDNLTIIQNSTDPTADTVAFARSALQDLTSSSRKLKDKFWKVFAIFKSYSTQDVRNCGLGKYPAFTPQNIEVAGYQLEVGSVPTSFIPTNNEQVTRSADLLKINIDKNCTVYMNTTQGVNVIDKPSGQWNIDQDLSNGGIYALTIFDRVLTETEKQMLNGH